VIGEEGEQHGVIELQEALRLAREAGMDLVEVDPSSNPPVCKIMDFGKFKYRQKKKQHQAQRHHTAEIKEIRLKPKTEEHDMDHKIRHAAQFLADGDKVLVSMKFWGREMAHIDLGRALMKRFSEQLADVAKIERDATMEGRNMTLMLAPKAPAPAHKPAPEKTEKPDAKNENP
jgi:translation initiation factor IF-3